MSLLESPRNPGWIGCIDFGTSFSKFAMVRNKSREDLDKDDIQPLPISVAAGFRGKSPFLLPSVLFLTDDKVLFGADAELAAKRAKGSVRQAFSSPKQFLSTHDLLAFDAPIEKEIDPTGNFTPRMLLSLFMAHLLERAGTHATQGKLPWPVPLRIARPAWDAERSTVGEKLLKELVVTGFALVDHLGKALAEKGGVSQSKALSAFKRAIAQPLQRDAIFKLSPDGSASVLEATAVAAGSLRTPGRRVVTVADIGGGTSDFGSFMTGTREDQLVIAEIEGGSSILKEAGDYLDMQLRRIILERVGYLEDDPAASAAVRSLRADQRDLKERLFTQKELTVEVGEEFVDLTLDEFLLDEKVQKFSKRLRERFHQTLITAAQCAANYPAANGFRPQIEIMLTGGGNALPMVKALYENPSLPGSYTPRSPELLDYEDFDFSLVRRQLAVAIGGAMRDLPKTRRIAV